MEEITKHSLKIFKTIRNPSISLKKKIGEIFIEILIITFAVTLAQFLERQREENIRQNEVKEFLLGLKSDLKSDILQTGQIIESDEYFKISYTYLGKISDKSRPNKDTLDQYVNLIGSYNHLTRI